ncbi:MAG TPA: hypothetical protein VKT74_05560 [Gammaproteobacteria bacterium]|nr:hypothetical protein [Gammaproteobacteria bacterium]
MHKIFVRLPMDRDYAGLLEVETPGGTRIAGPYEVCGRADDALARDHRNPGRDPLLPFGDIPYGEYWVAGIVASGEGTEYGSEEYGPAGVVILEPRNGDAALADANGRFRFLIHGGRSAPQGGLRPTDGALRLSNRDQRDLVGVLRRLQGSTGTCLVVQAEYLRTRRVVAAPQADEPRYAQVVSALTLSALSRRSRMLAAFWLRAMMGATGALVAVRSALGFSLGNTPSDASGNLRSALLAKDASSGLSGKPHFTAGRLYAQKGGDYTQPAPEGEQAPAPQQQTPTAPEEQVPAPQQTRPAGQPQPEEETPTPKPQDETPAPAPQEETPAPMPGPSVVPNPVGAVRTGAAAAVQGEVYRLTSSGRKVPITSGMPIFLNEHVVTGSTGRLQVLLLDETVFTIGPDSDMVLDDFVYDPATNLGKISAQITKGVFRFVTGKVRSSQPYEMKVTTPVDCLCFRGTDVEVMMNPGGTGYIRLYKGRLDIVQLKTNTVFSVLAGQMATLNADGSIGKTTPIKP